MWHRGPEPANGSFRRQRHLDGHIGRIIGWADAVHGRRKTRDQVRRVIEWAGGHPGLTALVLAWTGVISTAIAVAGLLAVLGSPPEGSAQATAARPRVDGISPIPALLARVEARLADNPDGPPPADNTAATIERISEALPNAAPDERERVNDLAAELFGRARTALEAGKVDEEQRWLALGSVLAPPPDIGPGETADAAERDVGGAAAARQDITPNEAEADPGQQDRQDAAAARPRRDFAMNEMPDRRAVEHGASTAAPRVAEPARDPSPVRQAPLRSNVEQALRDVPDELLSRRRVVVHYSASSGPAASEASRIAASLASKAGSVEIRAVNAVPRRPAIRYFYPEDQAAAQQLGAMLRDIGGQWATRAFTGYEPKPRLGTIELWIAQG